jgi:hypothetical protein
MNVLQRADAPLPRFARLFSILLIGLWLIPLNAASSLAEQLNVPEGVPL